MRAVIGDESPVFVKEEEGPLWHVLLDEAVVEAFDSASVPEVTGFLEVPLLPAAFALALAFRRVRAVPDEVVLSTAPEALHDATVWSSGIASLSFAHGAASFALSACQGGDPNRALEGSG